MLAFSVRLTLMVGPLVHALVIPPSAHVAACIALRRVCNIRSCAGDPSALASTAAAIDSIWSLPSTQAGTRRALAARERDASTHAELWARADWDDHTRKDRLLQILVRWPQSTLARALAPSLLVLSAWSCVVWKAHFTMTASALGWLATPLTLLLAFRVNSVIARLHEARTMWGQFIVTTRNLGEILAATSTDELPLADRALCCRYLVAFGWCAKAATRHGEEDVRPILHALLPRSEARAVAAARKPALALLALLRHATQRRDFSSHVARSVTDGLSELNRVYGGLERLLSMAFSPMYMRHTQRGLLLWLGMLPCGLLGAGCTSVAKLVLVVTCVAYLMLGIDEIAIQIEQPFEVLPLHSLAAILTKDIADAVLHDVHADSEAARMVV